MTLGRCVFLFFFSICDNLAMYIFDVSTCS
jgi:hypothetical protein